MVGGGPAAGDLRAAVTYDQASVIWDLEARRPRERLTAEMNFLRLLFPDKAYAVVLAFDAGSGVPAYYAPFFGDEGYFRGWKVDLQTPFRHTTRGFDSTDEVLDLMVKPDRGWQWKDEDRLARLVQIGLYSAVDAERIREVGRAVIPLIEAGAPPFDERWTAWRPTPDLTVGDVADGWQELDTATGASG